MPSSRGSPHPEIGPTSPALAAGFLTTAPPGKAPVVIVMATVLLRHCMFIAEKAVAALSSTRAWKIPWTEEPGGLQSMASRRVGHNRAASLSLSLSSLEKEMATHSSVLARRIPGMRGAWWAAVYGVTQSQTRLKWLSSSGSMFIVNRCFSSDQVMLPFPRMHSSLPPSSQWDILILLSVWKDGVQSTCEKVT